MTAWALPVVSTQSARLVGFPRRAQEAILDNKWRIFTLDEPLAQGVYHPRFEGRWEVAAEPGPQPPEATARELR